MTPSRVGGRVGSRWSQSEAFPRHKAIAKRPKRWLEVSDESEVPHLSSMALLIWEMVWMVSSASLPRVSAIRGTKSVPEERQAERLEASFR